MEKKVKEAGLSLENRFQTKDSYIHRKIVGNNVLISIGENIANFNGYIELNASAAFLWEEMKAPHTIEELSKALETQFNLSDTDALEDVLDFLKELLAHDMVVVS